MVNMARVKIFHGIHASHKDKKSWKRAGKELKLLIAYEIGLNLTVILLK